MTREKLLYRELSQVLAILGKNTCSEEWSIIWAERKKILIDMLPHGSGIDYDYTVNYEKDKLIIKNSYHVMNENGFYDGIIDFTVTVIPDLICEFYCKVSGPFGKRQEIKEYLEQIYEEDLLQTVKYPEERE